MMTDATDAMFSTGRLENQTIPMDCRMRFDEDSMVGFTSITDLQTHRPSKVAMAAR